MSGIKGIVLLTRFDYIEEHYGREQLKNLIDSVEVENKNPLIQPVGISKDYAEIFLKLVDEQILQQFFNDDVQTFFDLGKWNAGHLMPRYFQIYLDEQNPGGFLKQMVILRPLLIGLGDMNTSEVNGNHYWVRINYGQPFLQSVMLSEKGFLEQGCRLCGAKAVKTLDHKANDISVEYEIKWSD